MSGCSSCFPQVIRRQGGKASVLDWATHSEMVEALPIARRDAEHLVNRIIEVTADPGRTNARLTFVEAGVDAAAQLYALQPGEDELGSFDPAQLAQGNCKAVLARVPAPGSRAPAGLVSRDHAPDRAETDCQGAAREMWRC